MTCRSPDGVRRFAACATITLARVSHPNRDRNIAQTSAFSHSAAPTLEGQCAHRCTLSGQASKFGAVRNGRWGVQILDASQDSGSEVGILQRIQWAPDAAPAAVQDVCVDHGRSHASVSEQLLYGSDVVTVLEQMGRERVSEGVTAGTLGDAGPSDRGLDAR